jgi:1,3-beta-glucan synthase
MSGYPGGGSGSGGAGQHDYHDGYAQNTDSYYQDEHNGQYYDQHDAHGQQPHNGYDVHGQQHNDGYYDES